MSVVLHLQKGIGVFLKLFLTGQLTLGKSQTLANVSKAYRKRRITEARYVADLC